MTLARCSSHNIVLALGWALVCTAVPAAAQAQTQRPARVTITVVDPSNSIVPGASVTLAPLDDGRKAAAPSPAKTSEKGFALFESVAVGRYEIRVEFPGFTRGVLRNVQIRPGENKHVVVLKMEKLEDSVTVAADRQAAASDRRNTLFGTRLTKEEIEALSDDPDELTRQLQELAGSDAIIRVDSFEGQQLPPRALIKSIHVTRDQFAAETEQPGSTFVDVITQAGVGRLRGGVNGSFVNRSLAGVNQITGARRADDNRLFSGNLSGTIAKETADFTIAVNGNRFTTRPELNVVLPAASRSERLALQQPRNNLSFNGTLNVAPTRDQTLRFGLAGNTFRSRNQGVGGFDLPERAFTLDNDSVTLRVLEAGPIGRRMFINTRLTATWAQSSQRAALEAPTIEVQDSFTSGGAQVSGTTKNRNFLLASDLDYIRGIHSWRTGVQVRGFSFRTDANRNYLGTYTFATLEDFESGRPILYTRSIGDPLVSYFTAQTGVYLQDDIRLRRGLTLSPGLRYSIQNNVDDHGAFEPRVGVTWSPWRDGRTTLRASTGIFHGWMAPFVIEQALRFDGFRQRELVINDPEWPEPGSDGFIPPTARYLIGDYHLQKSVRHAAGFERRFSQNFRTDILYQFFNQIRLPRGRNLNAPQNGSRPDPAFASVIETITDAEIRRHEVFVNFSWNLARPAPRGAAPRWDWRRLTLNGGFVSIHARRNAQGAYDVPPSGILDTEWGPGPADHRSLNLSVTSTQLRNLTVNLVAFARTGQVYTVRTGFDDNGDGLLNDRPDGVGLNSLRGSTAVNPNLRIAYALTRGTRAPEAPQTGPPTPRYRINLFANFDNVFNRANYGGYSGIMTSPFFMKPTTVSNPRRVTMGINTTF